jgi:hypothetical protein
MDPSEQGTCQEILTFRRQRNNKALSAIGQNPTDSGHRGTADRLADTARRC